MMTGLSPLTHNKDRSLRGHCGSFVNQDRNCDAISGKPMADVSCASGWTANPTCGPSLPPHLYHAHGNKGAKNILELRNFSTAMWPPGIIDQFPTATWATNSDRPVWRCGKRTCRVTCHACMNEYNAGTHPTPLTWRSWLMTNGWAWLILAQVVASPWGLVWYTSNSICRGSWDLSPWTDGISSILAQAPATFSGAS